MKTEKGLYIFLRVLVTIALILIGQNCLQLIDWNRLLLPDIWILIIALVKNLLYGFIIMYLAFYDIRLQQKTANRAVQYLILLVLFLLSIWNILELYILMPEVLHRTFDGTSTYFQLICGMWIAQIVKAHYLR